MKIEGHTHTQYCPHGSGDHVEQMIEKAIESGFDEYHITEHSPIPLSFSSQIKPIDALDSIAMLENEVDFYVKEMHQIRSKYKDRIQIKIGFELDYLPKHTEWTKHFLGEYGQYCDTGILSVHYVEGNDGWHCVDYKAEATLEAIVNDFGHTEKFQLEYYNLVLQSIFDDLGPYKPKRIGHMTLCNKFKQLVHCEETEKIFTIQTDILNSIKQHNYELDYNMAGLFKPLCEETYPPTRLIHNAKALKIPLIYGSDSHGIKDISRGYDVFLQNV